MIITRTTGSILDCEAQVLVNPVNTEGVMGAGLALQFKNEYPDMFADYLRACLPIAGKEDSYIQRQLIGIGCCHFYFTGDKFICNLPTKTVWKEKSRLSWVRAGLEDLMDVVLDTGIKSVAIPRLGCGLGGLDWAEVRPCVVQEFLRAPDTILFIYEV